MLCDTKLLFLKVRTFLFLKQEVYYSMKVHVRFKQTPKISGQKLSQKIESEVQGAETTTFCTKFAQSVSCGVERLFWQC